MKPSKSEPNEMLNDNEKHDLKRFISAFQCKKRLKENTLLFFTVVSVVSGAIIGFLLKKYTNFTPNQRQYFGFPGEIFLRMLKFIILPLITSSLVRHFKTKLIFFRKVNPYNYVFFDWKVTGVAGLGSHKAGKVASRAFIYYLVPSDWNQDGSDGGNLDLFKVNGNKICLFDYTVLI